MSRKIEMRMGGFVENNKVLGTKELWEAIKEIRRENEKLKAKLERAVDTVRFYAMFENWESGFVSLDDVGCYSGGPRGGKRARECLQEFEVKV